MSPPAIYVKSIINPTRNKTLEIMTIRLHISEDAYLHMLETGRRLEGSLGLTGHHEAAFTRYLRKPRDSRSKYIRLPHGRATVNDKRVSLTMSIDLDEADIIPSLAITDESREASNFVENYLDTPIFD